MSYAKFLDYRLLLWGEGARRADEGFQAFPNFTQIQAILGSKNRTYLGSILRFSS